MTGLQNSSDSKKVYIVATAGIKSTLTPLKEALDAVYATRDNHLHWSYVYNKDTFVTAEYSTKFMSLLDNDQRTMIAGDVDVHRRTQRDAHLTETKDYLKSSKIDYAKFCNTFTKYKQRDGVHDILKDIDSSVDNIVLLTGDIDDVLFNNAASGASMNQLLNLVITLADKCHKMGHKVSIVCDDMKASALVVSTVNIQHGTKPRLHLSKHCYEKRLLYNSHFISPGYLDDECNDEDESLRLLGSMAIIDGPNKGVVLNLMCGNVACTVHFPGLIATQDFDKQLYVYCDSDKLMHALQTCLIANKHKLEKISYNTEQHLMHAPSDREKNTWNHIFDHIKERCHNPTDDSEDNKSEVATPNLECRLVTGDERFTIASVEPLKGKMQGKGVDMLMLGKHTSHYAVRGFTNGCSMFWKYPKQCIAFLMAMVFIYATSMLSYIPIGNPLNIHYATKSMMEEVQDTVIQIVPTSFNDCLSMLMSDYCILFVCVCAMLFDAWTYMRQGGAKGYMISAALTISAGTFAASYVYDDMILFMISVSFVGLFIMKDSRTYIEVAYKKVKTYFVAASDGLTELTKARKLLDDYRKQKAESSNKMDQMKVAPAEESGTPSDGLTSKVLHAVQSVGYSAGKIVYGTKNTAGKAVDILDKDQDDHNVDPLETFTIPDSVTDIGNETKALINYRRGLDLKDQLIDEMKADYDKMKADYDKMKTDYDELKPYQKNRKLTEASEVLKDRRKSASVEEDDSDNTLLPQTPSIKVNRSRRKRLKIIYSTLPFP